jgi:hypothetical protein
MKIDGIFINFLGELQSILQNRWLLPSLFYWDVLCHQSPTILVIYNTNKPSWWPWWCICESQFITTMVSLKWFIRIVHHYGDVALMLKYQQEPSLRLKTLILITNVLVFEFIFMRSELLQCVELLVKDCKKFKMLNLCNLVPWKR